MEALGNHYSFRCVQCKHQLSGQLMIGGVNGVGDNSRLGDIFEILVSDALVEVVINISKLSPTFVSNI